MALQELKFQIRRQNLKFDNTKLSLSTSKFIFFKIPLH